MAESSRKKLNLLLIFFLLANVLSGVSFTTAATDPTIVLIEGASDYKDYGFEDLGIYYTSTALINFHMPFIVLKKGGYNLLKKDLSGSYEQKQGSFDKRFISSNYKIIAENDEYYVIDFTMKVKASNETFKVDFIPILKGKRYQQFAWWDSGWSHYRRVSISSSFIDAPLVDFVVLVPIPGSIANQSDGGSSVRFTNTANDTLYPFEIEYWNTSDSGESYIWVKIPRIENESSTQFNYYYNNSIATNFSNATDTWDTNCTGIWHLKEDPANAYPAGVSDSARATVHNATPYHMNGADHVMGQVGYGMDFDGTADFLNISDHNDFTPDRLSILMWVNPVVDFTDSTQFLMAKEANPGGRDWSIDVDGTNDNIDFVLGGAAYIMRRDDDGASSINGSWRQLVFCWDGSVGAGGTAGVDIYINDTATDDVSITGGAFAGLPNTVSNVSIATDLWIPTGTHQIEGIFDEIRFYDTFLNSSWVKAEFHSINRSSGFLTFGSEMNNTNINAPGNFNVTTLSYTTLSFNWTLDGTANYTHIRYRTDGYPASVTDGTLLYNNTGVEYIDTNLTAYTTYYYSAWAFNETQGHYSNTHTYSWNHTGPLAPTNILTDVNNFGLNISWTHGIRSNRTLVIYKNSSYPTSPIDGVIAYNGSNPYFNDTAFTNQRRYRIYAWNETVNLISNGSNAPWGGLTLYCYNENNDTAITFDVIISNEVSFYESVGCTNPHIVNLNNLPLGVDVLIRVNATGYNPRDYYITLEQYQHYILFTYLANTTNLYLLRVYDEIGQTVEDVQLRITRYINATYGFQNITIVYTGGAGEAEVYLVPGGIYNVYFNKSGYVEKYDKYIPDPTYYGLENPRIFTIYFLPTDTLPLDGVLDLITFEGYINRTSNTLYLNYSDASGYTLNTQIYVYEYNYSTNMSSLFGSENRTSNTNFQANFTSISNSNAYIVVLNYNVTIWGFQSQILIFERNETTVTTQTTGDTLFDLNYGTNPFGWSNTIVWFLLLGLYFGTTERELAGGLFISGILLLWINYEIGFNTILTTIAGGGIPMLHLFAGILVGLRDRKNAKGIR